MPGYPSQEEVDYYIKMRDEYIAEYILRNSSWADFLKTCRMFKLGEDFVNRHEPCTGMDGQCSFDCHFFKDGRCTGRG